MPDSAYTEEEPRLSEPTTLYFRGDWGQANMHRICGWLAQEVGDRSPDGTEIAVWSGRGGLDEVTALRDRSAHVSVITPAAAVSRLHQAGELDGLRALGVIGQRDRLVVAVDAQLPATSVADLASTGQRLTIATSPDDGVNLIGFAAHRALRAAGLDLGAFDFKYDERPFPPITWFTEGDADVLIHEAIMTPHWQRLDSKRPVKYLPWGDAVLDAFAAEGWPSATVEAGYLPGLTEDLRTLDFADFVILCRADLDDEIAYLITWCMIKTRRALEAQYAHLPPDHTPVTYPIVPADMARTPLPLHPAAERAYRDLESADVAGGAPIWS